MSFKVNPKFDLILERTIDVPVELVWKAWTIPEHIVKWFCPKPFEVYNCEVDLRPGGIYRTDMRGPDMPDSPCVGCILEVIPNEKFVWTSVMAPGFRPNSVPENGPDLLFTGMIQLEDLGGKTKYTAIAIHPNEETAKRHAELGFHDGWGICVDQLVAEIKAGRIS